MKGLNRQKKIGGEIIKNIKIIIKDLKILFNEVKIHLSFRVLHSIVPLLVFSPCFSIFLGFWSQPTVDQPTEG